LSSPQIGSEYFVTDSGRRYATGQQCRSDEPHERQRTAGEDLNVVWEWNLAQVHEDGAPGSINFPFWFGRRAGLMA
jgi:hypothetical protein